MQGYGKIKMVDSLKILLIWTNKLYLYYLKFRLKIKIIWNILNKYTNILLKYWRNDIIK